LQEQKALVLVDRAWPCGVVVLHFERSFIVSIRRMTFGPKYELKKFLWIVLYLILNSRQSRLNLRIRLSPCLEPCSTTKKYYCLEEKMTPKKMTKWKNTTKIRYLVWEQKKKKKKNNNDK
jgi:predicted Fe-S protein YdhL (DUF1289 family)